MKTAISIPDSIFLSAEKLARNQKISRSELYAKAVLEYLKKHQERQVTEALNQVYAHEESAMEAVTARLQELSIFRKEW